MAVFFSSLISFVLFAYFLKDLEMFLFACFIIRIIFVLTFYVISIYILRSSYVTFIFAYFFITFVSAKIAMSVNIHIVLISWIIMSCFIYY